VLINIFCFFLTFSQQFGKVRDVRRKGKNGAYVNFENSEVRLCNHDQFWLLIIIVCFVVRTRAWIKPSFMHKRSLSTYAIRL
jgi:hypothetical protein